MTRTKIYKTAMYVRLSKGDEDKDGYLKSESDSITNQKLLIEDFINARSDLMLCGTYIDDGYTGTNFDRPKMKEMMQDIDAGSIDCIVCKDLSRFGRERIETGTYIAKTFKEKGVRFIAINDNYDTLTADGAQTHIVMPIKALTNDSFSRDISIKVRSSQQVKRERGEFVSAFAPYGYKKSADNKNHLVFDPYAAKIVKDIFSKKISGYSASAIAEELNELGVMCPSEYKKAQGEKFSVHFGNKGKYKWSAQTVIRILKNEVYIGNLVQGKTKRVSYKVRKELVVPEDQWVRSEGAHEAIVSRTVFFTVQDLMNRDTIRKSKDRASYIHAGILFCGDCGSSMVRRAASGKSRKGVSYMCTSYNEHRGCSRHFILEDALSESVERCLREHLERLCSVNELRKSLKNVEVSFGDVKLHDDEVARLKEQLIRFKCKKDYLQKDLRDGVISERQYESYHEQYVEGEKQIEQAITEQEKIIHAIYERGIVSDLKLSALKERLSVNGLDRFLLVTFINRILVYEDGRIEILFRFEKELAAAERILNGKDKKQV